MQDAPVPLKWDAHSTEDVSVHASGPMAHLFNGVQEQSYVAHAMMYASCVGPNQEHCENLAKQPKAGAHHASVGWNVVCLCVMAFLLY